MGRDEVTAVPNDPAIAETAMKLSSWNQRGRVRAVAAICLMVALPATAFVVGRRSQTLAESINQAAPPRQTPVTSIVERGVIDEGAVFRGIVVAHETPVEVAIDNPKVVTDQIAQSGDAMSEGEPVVELDDRPVLLLEGVLPLIRDLHPGDVGSVVDQLQRALHRMGYLDVAGASGTYDVSTAAAVASMYMGSGYDPPGLVGTDALADAQLAQLAAEDEEAAAASAYGQAKSAGAPTGDLLRALRRAREAVESTKASVEVASLLVGVPLLASEVVFLPSLPATVVVPPPGRGSVVTSTTEVAVLAAGNPSIRVQLLRSEADLISIGTSAELIGLEGENLSAAVVAIEEEKDEAGFVQGFVATIETTEPIDWSALGTGMRVRLGPQSVDDAPHLIVPSIAIRSDSNGNTYVLRSDSDGTLVRVVVTELRTSGGISAIETAQSDSLADGDRVVVGFDEPDDPVG